MNVRTELQNLSLEENRKIRENLLASSSTFAVAVINLSGDLNVGMSIRSSELFGAKEFFLLGRKKYDRRFTVGSNNYLPIVGKYLAEGPNSTELDMPKLIEELKKIGENYTLVAVEQSRNSVSLLKLHSLSLERPCFIFGNEAGGIPKELLDICKHTIEIPQKGIGRSFNVAMACTLVCYEWNR